jgi:hypothetical protein
MSVQTASSGKIEPDPVRIPFRIQPNRMNPKPIATRQTVCGGTHNTHRSLVPMIPKVVMAIAALWSLSGQVRANDPMLIPPTRVGSSNWGANESVNQLFSWATPVIGQPDPGYFIDTGGHAWDSAGEVNLIAWMDFGEDKVFTALDFATQSNNDGFNRVKLWISNDLATFTVVNGNTPPPGTPDLNVTCGANANRFARYVLPAPATARYVVAQFLSERVPNASIYHPRAWELRMEGTTALRSITPILTNTAFINPTTFGFTLVAEANRTYSIESSIDLDDWSEILQVPATAAETPIEIPKSPSKPNQFFRASVIP